MKMKTVIGSENDMLKRMEHMDENTRLALFSAFKVTDLYTVMKDEEKYQNVMKELRSEIELYQFYEQALNELQFLCCAKLQEDLPEVILEKMLDTYDSLDVDNKMIFRRKLQSKIKIQESLGDLKYNWNLFCESMKKNASE